MRWFGQRQSDNVEDRRGMGGGGKLVVGGGAGVVVIIVALLLGVDPRALLQTQLNTSSPPVSETKAPANDEAKQFVAVVLGETEDVWHEQFQAMGKDYREPKLVLFTDAIESGCGIAGTAVGPFY